MGLGKNHYQRRPESGVLEKYSESYSGCQYEHLDTELSREVSFITTQELEDLYPDFTPKERENAYTKEHKTVCIMQIGDVLASGQKHDGRAPDYDDWKLNCDILFWHEPLQCALEISSMGIRVDEKALD